MAKYLKRYNAETGKWEIVSAPDVSVERVVLPDGSQIDDRHVKVTSYSCSQEGKDVTLDETLNTINDNISELKRNVSWLAKHGGNGGSGGGGGSASSYGIQIISPVVENGSAYINSSKFELEFMITGGTAGDICTFTYEYDSERATDAQEITVGTSVKRIFDNTGSSAKEHSIIIRATNPFGNTIAPVSFKIYESTLALEFDKKTAGKDYENGIYNISLNGLGYIPLLMTNGIVGSAGNIVADCLSETVSFPFTGTTTETEKKTVEFWKIIPQDKVEVGGQYVITFNSTATLGTNTAKSEEFKLRVKIINPSELTLSIGINGNDSSELTEAPLNSTVNYNFKAYGPSSIVHVYYAVKAVNNKTGNTKLILGRYYDDTLKEEGARSYLDNSSTRRETTISSQFTLSDGEGFYSEGDTVSLYIKAWGTGSASLEKESHGDILITKEIVEVFPRQYSRRDGNTGIGDTLFASWNNANASLISPNKWTSKIINYNFVDDTLRRTENSAVTLDINVYNGNISSGIQTKNSIAYLRLQNHAYAICNLGKYYPEMQILNDSGFTVSITVETDTHSDTLHTVFLWGSNNASGSLSNGFRIDVDKVYWAINEMTEGGSIKLHTLSCNISNNIKNSVDFVYDGNAAKIYINGILNAAVTINAFALDGYYLPQNLYFGANYYNANIYNYSDVKIYDFSIYTKELNDLQIVVNSKSWRLNGPISDTDVKTDYNTWLVKNFIEHNPADAKIPISTFYSNGKFKSEFSGTEIRDIAVKSSIPTLYLNFDAEANFTEKYFHDKHTSEVTKEKYASSAYYYDPSNGKWLDNFKVYIALQGTSTLGYRIKNLEMYISETVVVDGVEVPKLFQPKKEWFPEQEFTLKADVVDSAHANNAVLGEWINNSGTMNPNPAMSQFSEATRPKDVNERGEIQQHQSGGRMIDYDEDVQIKHTLEGFPILVFIKFSEKTNYDFIGIYSFNLGRYSYYNMGMKFLKNFSRWNNGIKDACPALINYYQESEKLGTVNASDIFSFEFGNAGNLKILDYPVWSQYDKSVVQSYGEFRYPGNVSAGDNIWNKLCTLFENAAKLKIGTYYGDAVSIFDDIKKYTIDNAGNYVTDGTKIAIDDQHYTLFANNFNVNNGVAYFIIANAFGMTDSLGKNLTLRTWDGGNTWYPCFYDMDTALGLTNDGAEDVPVTASIDKMSMISDPTKGTTTTGITYHYEESKFAAVLSKLWGILRSDKFLYETQESQPLYELMWAKLRQTDGKLSMSSNFTDIMSDRISTCGELIYDYDYNSKYISDTNEQEEGVTAAINFLHGTRIEFVKSWLTKHFYFLDGMFKAARIKDTTYTYEDSPFNSDIFTTSVVYNGAIKNIPFTLQVTTPSFISMQIGNDAYKDFYIDEANKDTVIYLSNNSSSNSQLNVKGSTLLSKLDGLQGGFQNLANAAVAGSLYSLTALDLSNSNRVTENPFIDSIFVKNGNNSLETLNLQGTKGENVISKYDVDLSKLTKILNVDVSNSQVSNLVLPLTSLQKLNVSYSNITSLTLKEQNILTGITFEGCNRIYAIEINNCTAIKKLTFQDKPLLENLNVINCGALEEIYIDNCPVLSTINITNNTGLKKITIKDCINTNIEIKIINSPLEEIYINGIESAKRVVLPSRDYLTNVRILDLNNFYSFDAFTYGDETVTYVDDDVEYAVFDLTAFPTLLPENIKLKNVTDITHIKVRNEEDNPYDIAKINGASYKNLYRVFGHISLTGPGVFSSAKNFIINKPLEKIDGKTPFVTPVFNPDPWYTNITVDGESLDSTFSSTKCTLSDVYYILQKCNSKVTSMSSMFGNCGRVIVNNTDMFEPTMFSKCGNVTNINGIFAGCKISGDVPYNLFHPLHNLETFEAIFGYENTEFTIDNYNCIFPIGNTITGITAFQPSPRDPDSDYGIVASVLLKNLPHLKSLTRSFNNLMINFADADGDLFGNNPELETLDQAFRGTSGFQDLETGGEPFKDIFGLKKIKTIKDSLSFVQQLDAPCKMLIGNSFLANIKETIEIIDESSLKGSGLDKEINYDDCGGEDFPYEIFDGCANLKQFAGIFSGIKGKADVVVDLPRKGSKSLFDGCYNIENLSECFANVNIPYRITANGFVNCPKLRNVSNMFADEHGMRQGMIPYHLFYNGGTKTILNMNNCFSAQKSKNVIPYTCSDDVINEYLVVDNTETAIETLHYADSSTALTTISRDLLSNGDVYVVGVSEDSHYLILKNVEYSNIIGIDEEGHEGWAYVENPNIFHKKLWNKKISDGTPEFMEKITNNQIRQDIIELYSILISGGSVPARLQNYLDEHGVPVLSFDLPFELTAACIHPYPYGNLDSGATGYEIPDRLKEQIKVNNYFCPPDFFDYCQNSEELDINNAFNGAGSIDTNAGYILSGMYGKICPFLFSEISMVRKLVNIFAGFATMWAHEWGYIKDQEGEIIETVGSTYPESLFKGLTNVRNIDGLFSGNRIWGRTAVPLNLFSPFAAKIENANSVWANAVWVDNLLNNVSQLDANMFQGFSALESVIEMFVRSNVRIQSSIFTVASNPLIKQVNGFMSGSGGHGSVPEFWNGWSISAGGYEECYRDIIEENISNYNNIPNRYK